jgi:DNA invertase Pin-like site-specific DNA recombinase
MKEVRPGRAYGYCRASTEEQETTLEAQQHDIKDLFDRKFVTEGYTWGDYFVDRGISGGTRLANRPEGHKLSITLEPGDLVIMQKIDRGWRNVADFCATLEVWKAKRVRIALIAQEIDTGTPAGLMAAQMLAVFSEFERGMVGERMRHFFAQRKRAGRPYCRSAPYGFKVAGPKGDRVYVPFPEQRAIGGRIVGWRDMGWTYEEIALHLDRHKIRHPATGGTISPSMVLRWELGERGLQAREENGQRA